MTQATSFISHAEEIIDDVAHWGVEYINGVVDALSPDGRPFGMEKRTQRDQLRDYMQLRGNHAAWGQWIEERAQRIRTLLQEARIDEEEINSVHPYSIVEAFAIQYSDRMERLLSREEARAREEAPSPFPLTEDEVEDYGSGSDESKDS